MDKVQKLSNSECYTPSSEPIRIYLCNRYGPGIYPSFVFFNFLEHWTMDEVQKLSNSECYAPSSEPIKIDV
jgi:hypothetical protein